MIRMDETVDQLVARAIPYLRRMFLLAVVTAVLCVAAAGMRGLEWGVAAAIVGVGGLVPIWLWIFRVQRGLPFLALVATQHLLWYGLPLATGHEVVAEYRDDEVLFAGFEFGVYAVALTISYAILIFRPISPVRRHLSLRLGEQAGLRRAILACLAALVVCCVYHASVLNGTFWEYVGDVSPGTASAIRSGFDVVGTASSLMLAYAIGRRSVSLWSIAASLICWTILFATKVASVYVSAIVPLGAAIAFGLFLGSGKVPVRFILGVVVVAAVLNLGKIPMRAKYWNDFEQRPLNLTDLPDYYLEWGQMSLGNAGTGSAVPSSVEDANRQSLVERISVFHMLLHVQRSVTDHHVSPLAGATYSIIPKLLVPRFFWEEKPRSHLGQVMLNVHYGLQSEEDTWATYISWGLLAEAYGNFGSIAGPALLGLVMGVLLALLERSTFGYPLDSFRCLAGCILFLGLVGIDEQVASTQLTTLFQMLLVVVVGSLPFLQRTDSVLPRGGQRRRDGRQSGRMIDTLA